MTIIWFCFHRHFGKSTITDVDSNWKYILCIWSFQKLFDATLKCYHSSETVKIVSTTSVWADKYLERWCIQRWLTLCTKRLFGFGNTVLSDVISGTLMGCRRVRCSIRRVGKTQLFTVMQLLWVCTSTKTCVRVNSMFFELIV